MLVNIQDMRPLLRARPALALSTLLIAGFALTACATAPTSDTAVSSTESQPPTLAPEQSVTDACQVSSEEIDQLVLLAEERIAAGIAQATTEAMNGEWPSFDFLQIETGESFNTLRENVINPEVSAAIDRVFVQFSGFAEIEQPETPFGVLPYLAKLGVQVDQLAKAGSDLAQLCGASAPLSTN